MSDFTSGTEGRAFSDYDNDGDLDLLVTRVLAATNFYTNVLYRNEGTGVFTRVLDSGISDRPELSLASSWVDYDNDGFLDLFGATVGQFAPAPLPNVLYHNDGNSNAWLNVKLVGTVSNRSAIGAKVRVNAFYRGESRWQLREISGGDSQNNQQSLNAEFGLGDSTLIDTLRVEWPSGIVEERHGVDVRQFLTITERLAQQIVFDPLADHIFGDPPFALGAAATSGLPVSYGASGSCRVAGAQVSLTGAGVCTITASQSGDAQYQPAADVAQVFEVLPAPGDADLDSVEDASDNCVDVANPSQRDTNHDGYGNACDADYNDSGSVDMADFALFRAAFNSSTGDPSYDPDVDANGSGTITIADFATFRRGFGRTPGPSGLACAGSAPCP